jgi:energy-coupling factor transporter transmembrane protein EcfT
MESDSPPSSRPELNPATKLVAALAAVALGLTLPAWGAGLVVVATFLLGVTAHRLRALAVVFVALLPVQLSALAINGLFPAGGNRAFGLEAALRLLSVVLPPSLLFLTTAPDRLLADLERRGLPPAAAFVVAAALGAVPRVRDRAQRVGEALRARGLDTDAGVAGRLRGLTPLGAAMVQGTLAEVEDRTLALEVRGFRSARRRTILRPPPDRAQEQAVRLVLLLVALVAIAARVWLG